MPAARSVLSVISRRSPLGPRRQKEDQRHYYDGGGEKEESEILFPRSAVRRLFYISVIHTISSSSEAGSSASISETVLCDTGVLLVGRYLGERLEHEGTLVHIGGVGW